MTKQSKRRNRRWVQWLKKSLATAAMLAFFAGFSIYFGDSLWDVIAPEAVVADESADALEAVVLPAAPLAIEAAEPVALAAGEGMVWVPASGTRYHAISTCSGMKDATELVLQDAKLDGYQPCKRCKPIE